MQLKITLFSYMIMILLSHIMPSDVRAEADVVTRSAELKLGKVELRVDSRVVTLSNYLKSKNSPFSEFAGSFIKEADRNNIDWRLVPSISGVESSFGKRMPQGSYNAYGWANGAFKFKSWDHSIGVVSEALNTKYYKKGAVNINKIARRYAPPSLTWSSKVKYFMNKIDPIPVTFDL